MKHASTAMKALALSFALSLAPINGAWAQGNAVKGTVVGDDGRTSHRSYHSCEGFT